MGCTGVVKRSLFAGMEIDGMNGSDLSKSWCPDLRLLEEAQILIRVISVSFIY